MATTTFTTTRVGARVRASQSASPRARLHARASRASASSASDAAADVPRVVAIEARKPLGLTLEAGARERGAFIADVRADGRVAVEGLDARRGDVVREVNGRDARAMTFDDVMSALADGPETATLKLARWPSGKEMTNARDRAWLEANSLEDGVVTLASGLQYRVVEKGAGPGNIKMDTPCECHYAGTLIDGTEFDSSYKRGKPITFAPKQVIKAWTEAMRLMREGDKWELFCPSELAYGARGSGRFIKPGDALVFSISIERKL